MLQFSLPPGRDRLVRYVQLTPGCLSAITQITFLPTLSKIWWHSLVEFTQVRKCTSQGGQGSGTSGTAQCESQYSLAQHPCLRHQRNWFPSICSFYLASRRDVCLLRRLQPYTCRFPTFDKQYWWGIVAPPVHDISRERDQDHTRPHRRCPVRRIQADR